MPSSVWLASPAPLPHSSAGRGPAPAPVCVENIGAAERRRRARFGALTLVVALVLAALLILSGADRAWRLVLFIPFAAAGTGFFQAYEKT